MRILVILVTIGLIAFVLLPKNKTEAITSKINPSATPFPFEEMTIPYLHAREYKSNLNQLEKFRDAANYTSYLTSYESDGLKINGLITIPKTEKPEGHPAIVFVHGYIAPSIYKTTEKYVEYVDYLARNGFVVFKIDLRGHGDSEGDAGGSYYSSDYIADTLSAYSALQNADFVDAKKVALWGHSMAGNVTFRSFVAKKDIPAVVIWSGAGFTYEDLITYRINDNSYRPPTDNTKRSQKRAELRAKYGEFTKGHEFWEKVVPINYLQGVTGAISLHHAVDDSVVSIEYSRNLDNILNETDITHELNEYPSGGHNISGSSFGSAMGKTIEFLKTNLSL